MLSVVAVVAAAAAAGAGAGASVGSATATNTQLAASTSTPISGLKLGANTIQLVTIYREAICRSHLFLFLDQFNPIQTASCKLNKAISKPFLLHMSTTFYSDVIQFFSSSRIVTSRKFISEASLNRIMEFDSLFSIRIVANPAHFLAVSPPKLTSLELPEIL